MCGHRVEKNLFQGHGVSLVVPESFLDRDFAGRTAEDVVHALITANDLLTTCGGCGRVYVLDETNQRPARIYRPDTRRCDECGSRYRADTSKMTALCPECAHWLYGYDKCEHDMRDGRCTRCNWDGSVSAYVAKLRGER